MISLDYPFENRRVILCVDDDPNILSALRRLLRRDGYIIFIANSGSEGLQILEQQLVDLVISDMRMPEMDGSAFLKQVRAGYPETVRLLLTGYSSTESMQAAIIEGGIYRCLSKPWCDDELLKEVRHALATKA